MPQAVENRARAVVELLAEPTAGPSQGWVQCQVRVSAATDVPGYPNLLTEQLPREMVALVPVEEAVKLAADPGPQERLVAVVAPRTVRILSGSDG